MQIVDLPGVSQVASLLTWVGSFCTSLLARIKSVVNSILFNPAPANTPTPMQDRDVVPEDRVSYEAAENIQKMQSVLGGLLAKKRADNAFLYELNQQLKDLLHQHAPPQAVCSRHWSQQIFQAANGEIFPMAGIINGLPTEPPDTQNQSLQNQAHAEANQFRIITVAYRILKGFPDLGPLREEIQKLPTDNEALQALMEA